MTDRDLRGTVSASPAVQVAQATGELALLTGYTPACCSIAASPACIERLLQVVQTCSRRQADQKTLHAAYIVLCNLSKYPSSAAVLLEDQHLLPTLAGQLQALRDNQVLTLAKPESHQDLLFELVKIPTTLAVR